ncbi:MAG: DNA adenine methylase [Candidatus Symbiothrix sp.]|jgi:adenine-specific DNA methylase|nr:DNA adenine methylase [Candidatus Symbiothrix sp.]
MCLFDLTEIDTIAKFPSTRYQGSKLKYTDWIWHCVKDLSFETVLDAFGGTGCVAHRMKQEGKSVTYNDILKFNSIIGKALIENEDCFISDRDLSFILNKHSNISYSNFIERTFADIYFTDDENHWLDIVATNIRHIQNEYKQAVAWFALFQSCIIKRPYNLFHRKNLYIRTQDVERSFGNKVTWDTPFPTHYRHFIEEANAAIFFNGKKNRSLNKNVFNLSNHYDLVYIDTPYISEKGIGVDYLDFYHFLEGLVDYENWENRIDYQSKHKRLKINGSEWTNPQTIEHSFECLLQQFKDSILAISYRSDGIPNIYRICEILKNNGKQVVLHESRKMQYVLSKKQSTEILIIGK